MCYTEDLLVSTDPSDHTTFKKHYEKLGDGACHLKNYAGAVEYYLKMLDHAELAGDCGKSLIPIYVRYVVVGKWMDFTSVQINCCFLYY